MTIKKGYSTLVVKSVDQEKRIIKGIASTIEPDQASDIVEPNGMMFDLPLPFLWQHDHTKPIGNVINAKRTSKGLEIEVQIANIKEVGTLKDQVDHAWQAIKEGLVRGLSIGFKALDFDVLPSGGLHFTATELHEISAVTIPCNAQATITEVKRAATVRTPKPKAGVKLNTDGIKLPDFVTTQPMENDLSHSEKMFAAKIAYLEPMKRIDVLKQFADEFGQQQADKIQVMCSMLRGDV